MQSQPLVKEELIPALVMPPVPLCEFPVGPLETPTYPAHVHEHVRAMFADDIPLKDEEEEEPRLYPSLRPVVERAGSRTGWSDRNSHFIKALKASKGLFIKFGKLPMGTYMRAWEAKLYEGLRKDLLQVLQFCPEDDLSDLVDDLDDLDHNLLNWTIRQVIDHWNLTRQTRHNMSIILSYSEHPRFHWSL
jgi:hypothetical protein